MLLFFYNNTVVFSKIPSEIKESVNCFVVIHKSKIINDEIYFLFTDLEDKKIGFAVFKKNIMNRYEKERIGIDWSESNYITDHFLKGFKEGVEITIIIGGLNPDNLVSYITYDLNDVPFKKNVNKYYLFVHKVQTDNLNEIPKADLRFYDSDNKDITNEIN